MITIDGLQIPPAKTAVAFVNIVGNKFTDGPHMISEDFQTAYEAEQVGKLREGYIETVMIVRQLKNLPEV